jgi:hypothetical protein
MRVCESMSIRIRKGMMGLLYTDGSSRKTAAVCTREALLYTSLSLYIYIDRYADTDLWGRARHIERNFYLCQ